MTTRRGLISTGAIGVATFGLSSKARSGCSGSATGGAVQYLGTVSSRDALSKVDGSRHSVMYLAETGREGIFEWKDADLSTEVPFDPQQGLYVAGANQQTGSAGAWKRGFEGPVRAEWFGVVGDGLTDSTAALEAAIAWMRSRGGGILALPAGTIVVHDLGNLACANLTIQGQGMQHTILKAQHSGVAFLVDAFPDNNPDQNFIDQFNLEDITLEGNDRTSDILMLQGVSRSHFIRVDLREAGVASSKALHLRCAVTCLFMECYVSVNYKPMAHRPRWGIYADHGGRGGVSTGHTSNCTFVNCEMNGALIGVELARADQTSMIGGACQNCVSYGMIIRPPSRYNSFSNVAFENLRSRADVVDQGVVTSFEGCYFSEKIEFAGEQCRVRNCFGERFEVKAGAEYTDIANIRFNHWNTGEGGFFDASRSTRVRSLYDVDAEKYL